MLDAYDGSVPHPRSKAAFQDERGHFVSTDDDTHPAPSDCIYRFNSLGFRGEEFDPAARLKIFVAGCSYTFGLGVPDEQTWPVLLKKLLADRLGIPLDQANLQNFSQVGASNGYIARTIVRQCDRVRPDVAVIAFTHRERSEYLAPGVTRNLGLWDLDHPADWAAPAIRYFDLYNTESASLDLLKNMLMVEWAMIRRRIPYLLLWMNRTNIDQAPIGELAPLRRLRAMIDPDRLGSECLLDPEIMVDSNVADRHPGPRSHANFASRVFGTLDLSVPAGPAVKRAPETPRRVLVLGGPCPMETTDGRDCNAGRCACRRMNLRHGFVAATTGRPLVEHASNDRILRTLVEECSARTPDFVFARFSDGRACEHFQGQELVELDLAPPGEVTPQLAALIDAYREFTTDELCHLNALRNLLMAQEFLEARQVPHILSIPPALGPQAMNAPDRHPVLRAFASLIDPASLCTRRHEPATAIEDRPAPGGRATELTRELVRRLKRRFGRSQSEDPNIYPLW